MKIMKRTGMTVRLFSTQYKSDPNERLVTDPNHGEIKHPKRPALTWVVNRQLIRFDWV
jgi:hypothetical protein